MRSFADRKPTQLSGGQQQRVALARALVNRPSVLLLDEPLGALDRQLREEMQVELKLLQSQLGITFVFVTHDQGEALSMSDRIAIMRRGRIEQLADPDSIYANPASAYVAGFVGQQNFFRGEVAAHGHAVEAPESVVAAASAPAAGLRPGSAGVAAVRPEFVRISRAGAGGAPGGAAGSADASAAGIRGGGRLVNAARGTLLGISHLGETMQYLVQLGGERTLIARRPTPEAPAVAVGDEVICEWEAAHVLLFADDEEAGVVSLDDPVPTSALGSVPATAEAVK
jgi:ABC-type Fe3+/spermidine/putrescine transport system ATPase subunit